MKEHTPRKMASGKENRPALHILKQAMASAMDVAEYTNPTIHQMTMDPRMPSGRHKRTMLPPSSSPSGTSCGIFTSSAAMTADFAVCARDVSSVTRPMRYVMAVRSVSTRYGRISKNVLPVGK